MKYTTLKAFAFVGLLLVLAAASVPAQTRNTIKVNIPFDFAVGDARLKAGQYLIDRVDITRLVVTSEDGKARVLTLAPRPVERTRGHASEKLVFHRYGDMYFLSEAWIDGSGNGLYPSKAERSAARELAKANGKPDTTEIVARVK